MKRTMERHSFLLLGILIAYSAEARTKDLHLMCTVEESSDSSAETQVPRPKDLVTVAYSPSGEVVIASKLHKVQLTGTVKEHDISAQGRGSGYSIELYINRYTTEYRYQMLFDDPGRAPVRFFGSCQAAKPAR